jgi:hypothetical protein
MSAQAYVDARWKDIGQMVLDAVPIEPAVRSVEAFLDQRREMLGNGSLSESYEWGLDLHLADTHHKFALDWVPRNQKLRDDYTSFWRDSSKRMLEFTERLSLAGISTLILLHGAVAIGALNALSEKAGELSSEFIFAAKLTLGGSLIGIFLIAWGQLTLFVFWSEIGGTISGRLLGPFKFKRFNALRRYLLKYRRKARTGDYLIYASLFWFFIYCAVAYIVLL